VSDAARKRRRPGLSARAVAILMALRTGPRSTDQVGAAIGDRIALETHHLLVDLARCGLVRAEIVGRGAMWRLDAAGEAWVAVVAAAVLRVTPARKVRVVDDTAVRAAYERGARAAADVAAQYDPYTSHDYRLGDCVLGKLNLRQRPPRKNRRRLPTTSDARLHGFLIALVELARYPGHGDPKDMLRVARDAGVTLAEARRVGAGPRELVILRRLGIPRIAPA